MSDVTRILSDIAGGNGRAADELLPLVYDELRKLATARLAKEPSGSTLDPTALVHEAYVRLVGPVNAPQWENSAHFFSAAATAMRRILIERARYKLRAVHGGGRKREELDPEQLPAPQPNEDLLALDSALVKLAEQDAEKAQLVELRYFAGLNGDQAAKILNISPSTADRHWTFARAWLRREIESGRKNA